MRLNLLAVISIVILIGCDNSPEQLMERGSNYLEKGNYGKAIDQFEKLILKFPQDPVAETAHFQIVNIMLDLQEDYMAGYNVLNEIIIKYPNSPRALIAREDVENFPSWLFIKSDFMRNNNNPEGAIKALETLVSNFPEANQLAQVRYAIADIYLVNYRDEKKAVELFKKVSAEFSDTPQGPHAQFMAGYINANMIGDFDNAKKEYEYFLEQYSDHDLASSVEFELGYLGQNIDDIITLKQIKE